MDGIEPAPSCPPRSDQISSDQLRRICMNDFSDPRAMKSAAHGVSGTGHERTTGSYASAEDGQFSIQRPKSRTHGDDMFIPELS